MRGFWCLGYCLISGDGFAIRGQVLRLRILRSNFLIPVVNHDFFHYSGIRKWAAVEMKHILMIEVKI